MIYDNTTSTTSLFAHYLRGRPLFRVFFPFVVIGSSLGVPGLFSFAALFGGMSKTPLSGRFA